MDADRDRVRGELVSGAASDAAALVAIVDALTVQLGDATTPGSIRAWRTQDAATLATAASMRALADIVLQQAQANRRLSRQVLRLTRLTTGDLTSSNVGTE